MPNWCEGILKIRGKQKDIIKFIEEKFVLYNYTNQTMENIKYIDDGKYMTLPDERFIEKELWVKDSRKMFVELTWDFEYLDNYDMEERITLCCNCRQGWGIDTEDLANMSLQYNLAFKIYAFERGGEFNQDIEVKQGKIIKDETIKYKDYVWECINPTIGG